MIERLPNKAASFCILKVGGMYMLNNYEWFKTEILKMTKIDLNYYKEKQMRRRIDTLVTKMVQNHTKNM